jgi:glutamate/tyrosine decarboxylase-like PLP-dependent enzyme
VFNEAVRHNTDWSRRIGSKVMVDKFVYHYVPSQGEDVSSACPRRRYRPQEEEAKASSAQRERTQEEERALVYQ